MTLEVDFPDMEAMEDCLASSIRPESHAKTIDVMQLFDGRFLHFVAQARSLSLPV